MKDYSAGPIRNLSAKYAEFRKTFIKNPRKISLNDSGSIINDTGKTNLISKKDKDTKIELQNWHLPPKYVEMFESVTDIMKELQSKFTKLEEDQQKRLMPKFNEEENIKIDKQIRDNITYMTRKIKECEDSIKQISYEKVDTPAEERSK